MNHLPSKQVCSLLAMPKGIEWAEGQDRERLGDVPWLYCCAWWWALARLSCWAFAESVQTGRSMLAAALWVLTALGCGWCSSLPLFFLWRLCGAGMKCLRCQLGCPKGCRGEGMGFLLFLQHRVTDTPSPPPTHLYP